MMESIEYAQDTKVPVQRSQSDIQTLVKKHGGRGWVLGESDDGTMAVVMFELADRRIRFSLPVASAKDFATYQSRGRTYERTKEAAKRMSEQQNRARWRALYQGIKAKLVNVKAGIETTEQAFQAQIMMRDPKTGKPTTVGEWMAPQLAAHYRTDKPMSPLMLPSGE